jgi:hypothetical protein
MSRPHGSPYPRQLALDICDAIARRCLIAFDYNGIHRVAQPYCHGFTRAGAETIRAVEVGGRGGAFGKLWTVAKMQNRVSAAIASRLTTRTTIPTTARWRRSIVA